MTRAIVCLLGEHDFSSFRAAGCEAAHPVRKIYQTALVQRGELLVYTIEATAFLRHMVRNIVGTLVEVGRGIRTAAIVRRIARCTRPHPSRLHRAAAWVYLVEVKYEPT